MTLEEHRDIRRFHPEDTTRFLDKKLRSCKKIVKSLSTNFSKEPDFNDIYTMLKNSLNEEADKLLRKVGD